MAYPGCARELNSKGSFTAPPGAAIALRAPGAGGYGPAAARDGTRLRDDVVNGYVSAEAAGHVYGHRDPAALGCAACRRYTTGQG